MPINSRSLIKSNSINVVHDSHDSTCLDDKIHVWHTSLTVFDIHQATSASVHSPEVPRTSCVCWMHSSAQFFWTYFGPVQFEMHDTTTKRPQQTKNDSIPWIETNHHHLRQHYSLSSAYSIFMKDGSSQHWISTRKTWPGVWGRIICYQVETRQDPDAKNSLTLDIFPNYKENTA